MGEQGQLELNVGLFNWCAECGGKLGKPVMQLLWYGSVYRYCSPQCYEKHRDRDGLQFDPRLLSHRSAP